VVGRDAADGPAAAVAAFAREIAEAAPRRATWIAWSESI